MQQFKSNWALIVEKNFRFVNRPCWKFFLITHFLVIGYRFEVTITWTMVSTLRVDFKSCRLVIPGREYILNAVDIVQQEFQFQNRIRGI